MAIFKKKSSKQHDRDHGARSPTNSPPVQAQPSITATVQRDVSNSYAPPNPITNPRRMTSQQLPFNIGSQGQTGRQSPSVTSPTQPNVPPSGSYPLGLGLPTPIQNQPSIMQVQNSAPGYNANNPGMMQSNPPGIMQNSNPPGIIQNNQPGIMQNANQGINNQGPPVQGQQAPAPGQPPNPGYPWSTRPLRLYQPVTNPPTAPLSPFPRYGLSVPPYPSHSGHMLLFGGLVRDHAHNDLWSLDVRDCQLQLVKTRGDAPLPRIGHVSAIADRIMLVFGGDTKITEDDKQDDGLYVLDLRTQEWTSVPVLAGPSGRYGHAACMLGGCLYVHGGHVDGRNLDDLWAFDIRQLAQDNGPYKWERITHTSPVAPLARTGHTLVPYRNKLYLFGGTDGDYHYNDSWSFDIVTGVWTELECIGYIPIPREGHAAAIVDDVVYVFGGRDVHGKDLGDLAAFRISNQRWYMFQNMGPSPMAKSGHSLCAAHGKIFVLGGESNLSPQVQRDDPNLIHVLDTTKIKYPADNQPPRGVAPRGRTTSDATDLRSANNSGPYQSGAPNQAQARSHDNLPRTLSPTVTASEPRPLIIANDTGANNSKHRAGSESISSDLGRQAPNLGPGGVLSPGFSTPNGVPPQRPKRDGDDEYRRAMSPPAGAGAMMAAGAGAGVGAAAAMGAVAATSMGPNGDTAPNEQTTTEGPQTPVSQASQTRELPANGSQPNGPTSPTSPTSPKVSSHTPHPNPRNSHSPPPELRFEGRPSLPPDAFYFGGKSPTSGGSRPGSMVGGRPGSLLGRPGSIVGNRPGSIAGTADLIREIKARENEADNAKRREAALRVILNKAIQQGYVVDDEGADLPSGPDEIDNVTTQQLVTVIMQMKQEKANLQNEVAAQMRVASDKIQDAERMQKGALQEAAYYRAKVAAYESGSTVEINRLDTERIADLERQLESTGKAYTPLTMEVERLKAEVDRHNEMTTLATEAEADTLKRAEEAEEANAQLQDELEQLREQVSTKDKSINEHTERFIMLTSTHQQREAERDQYKTQLDDAIGKREELLKLIEEAQAGIMAASARNAELEDLHGTAREQVSSLEAELAEVRQLLDAKTREAEQATARLAEAEALQNTTREEANSFRTMTSGRLGELLESHRALQNDDERAGKSYGDQMRALEEEKSSLLKLLREAGQRVDETESVATSHRQKARELEIAHQQMRGEMRVHRTKLHGAQSELSKYRDLCSAKDAELRERDQAVTELSTRVGLLRKVLGEHGIAVSDNDLDNAEAPSSSELETKLRDKSRAHDNAQREIEELTLRYQEAESKVESLGRLVERIKDGRSPSAASTRNTPSPTTTTGVGTPGDADRRAVEAERRLQEVEAQHRAKLAALEGDYQTAVRYVKGTEKMLKRMKDELNKQKSTNTALSNELDQMRGRAPSVEPGVSRSLSGRQTPSDSDLARRLQALQGQYSSLQAEIAAQADVLSARQREVDVLRMRCEESERENEVLREDLAQAQHRIATLLEMNQTGIHLGSDDEERVGLRRGSSASSDGGASTAFDKFTKELKQWERARSPDAHGDAESAALLSDHEMSVHSGSRGGSRADSRSNGNIAPSPGVLGSLPATLANGSRNSPGQTPIKPSVYSAASETGVVFPPAVAAGGADLAGQGGHAAPHGQGVQRGVHSRSSSSYSGDWTQ